MGHLVSPLVPTSALGAGAPTLIVCALAISASPPRRSDRRDHPRHRLPSRHLKLDRDGGGGGTSACSRDQRNEGARGLRWAGLGFPPLPGRPPDTLLGSGGAGWPGGVPPPNRAPPFSPLRGVPRAPPPMN